MKRVTLSVCILAKNEEGNIGQALRSAQAVADEIIVVDTGSTDRTVEIAQKFGARVIYHPWNDDFAEARNAGLDVASGDWVLMLDADEAIGVAMARDLPTMLGNRKADGYLQPVVNLRDGVPVDSPPILRLFRNRKTYRYVGRIHEQIDRTISSQGGCILIHRAPIEHYGYTAAEDQRKDRRNRNIRLLKRTLEENPEQYSAWYFLGMEYVLLQEFGDAKNCLEQAVKLGSTSTHVTLAGHRLAQIELLQGRISRGWELAQLGAAHPITRWDSALITSQVALQDGDYKLGLSKVRSLRNAPDGDFGFFSRRRSQLANLEGTAVWQMGDREKALQIWESELQRSPQDQAVASLWVRHKAAAEGLGTGVRLALGKIHTVQVASACVGALLRAGEIEEAADLARRSLDWGFTSIYLLYGLAYDGHWDRAEQVTANAGLEGALHLATAAAWFGQDETLARTLDRITGSWRTGLEQILSAQKVSPELLWVADILMVQWAEVGCLPLLGAAGRCLPGDPAAGIARAAWLAYRAGMTAQALEMALQVPDQPDALEVIGLTAFEHGDRDASAHFLNLRVEAGPASVQVYHKAARALIAAGNAALARQVLEEGLTHRPQSLLLNQELSSLGRRR